MTDSQHADKGIPKPVPAGMGDGAYEAEQIVAIAR